MSWGTAGAELGVLSTEGLGCTELSGCIIQLVGAG